MLPVLLVLAALAAPAAAIENCADILRFDYSTQAVLPILGEARGPGGAVVSVYALKDYAFTISNATVSYFFVSALDQYGEGGEKLAYAGEIFYKPRLLNETFMRRAGGLQPVYTDADSEFVVQADASYDFSFKETSTKVPVIRVAFPKEKNAFSIGSTSASAVVVLAKAIDPKVVELRAGSVFVESDFGLLNSMDGRVKFIGSCKLSCADPDALDYYLSSTCASNLVSATDFCATDSDLIEYYCTPGKYCAPQAFRCTFGCAGGRCITGDKARCESPRAENILLKGRTSGNYANGSAFAFNDACAGATKLRKYYCTADKLVASKQIDCPGLCENGACIEKPPEKPSAAVCVDTDGGRDYGIAGTCSDSTGSYKDQCSGAIETMEDRVMEYYCDDGYCKATASPCSACKDGACPKSEFVSNNNAWLVMLLVLVAGGLAYYVSTRRQGGHAPHEPGRAPLSGGPAHKEAAPEENKGRNKKRGFKNPAGKP